MRKTKQQENFESALEFHRREWRIQRVGWAFIAAFLLLALAGLFGGGPLSHARSGGDEDGSIEYERFTRSGAPTTLTITPAAAAGRGVKSVAMSASYLQAFRIEQVLPQPSGMRRDAERFVYEFASSSPNAPIVFLLHPDALGRHTATVVIDAGQPLTLSKFTYP